MKLCAYSKMSSEDDISPASSPAQFAASIGNKMVKVVVLTSLPCAYYHLGGKTYFNHI